MRYAAQSGIIAYNPAVDMAGALTTVKRQHRPALALNRISELNDWIYRGQPLTRLATKLTLLIFIRSSELRFARWFEIDFKKAMWTIPPERKPIEGEVFPSWLKNADRASGATLDSGAGDSERDPHHQRGI
jgi:integrase